MDAAAASGDGAVDEIDDFHHRFEAARPRLLAVCRAIVGADDAEDIVHETYLKARDRIAQLRNPASFEAWLVRIGINQARSLARHRASHRVRLGDADPPSGTSHRDVALNQLVDDLPIRERMAVVLFYGYGYSTAEVAGLLGISAINARTVLFRARKRLRSEWEAIDGRS